MAPTAGRRAGAGERPTVLVIGTGFGGIGLAAQLLRGGYRVTLLEQSDQVGGVWRENSYPGCACDVPSHLYSLSFAPNPNWSRRYSQQPEILAYLQDVARRFGVLPQVRFGTQVVSADYDDSTARWRVTSSIGQTFEADVLVPAVGQLSRPAWPDLVGLREFRGPVMHSAQWRTEVALAGRRVAVIGTGASAIQLVPKLVGEVSGLTVFQRSAPWVLPRLDHRYSRPGRWLTRRFPVLQRGFRRAYFALTEVFGMALTRSRPLAALIRGVSRAQLRWQVPDPQLRRRLVPDYQLGCKRVLFSSDWLPALGRPNVELITDRISEVIATGVRTADGREHPADVLVLGTGFAAADLLGPIRIHGRDGLPLHQVWADGARAYHGVTVPGFPNLFLLYGPNTNLGSGSIVVMIEAQIGYLLAALAGLRAGQSVEIRPEVAARFDAELQHRLNRSVWAGCASWYRTASGRITTNWPGLPSEYQRRLAFTRTDYLVREGPEPE